MKEIRSNIGDTRPVGFTRPVSSQCAVWLSREEQSYLTKPESRYIVCHAQTTAMEEGRTYYPAIKYQTYGVLSVRK